MKPCQKFQEEKYGCICSTTLFQNHIRINFSYCFGLQFILKFVSDLLHRNGSEKCQLLKNKVNSKEIFILSSGSHTVQVSPNNTGTAGFKGKYFSHFIF